MKFIFSVILLAVSLISFSQDTQKDTIQEMEEVVIEKKKKAVERRADRTIFDFSEQSHLNSGSLAEGLKKLPGLIMSDVAGILYQGKGLAVYMDGRPLSIYSDELLAYLEGMPANAVEKVEIITRPGAEFPATSGGAIINIITSKKAQKYLSATYSNGYRFTGYDKNRHRFHNSISLSAANSLFSWQLQGGQNYNENFNNTEFTNGATVLSDNFSDRFNRFYYLKTGLKFDFSKDRLLVNYDITTSRNTSFIEDAGAGFTAVNKNLSKGYYQDVMITYQKRFDDPFKKLDFRINYNNNNSDFNQKSRTDESAVLNNGSNQDFYQFKTDYSQEIIIFDKSKISAGILADRIDFKAINFGAMNLDYTRKSYAAYTEAQATYKSFEFILGGRLETYDIEGTTVTSGLIPFRQTRFFPNGAIQYNIMPQVHANVSYNKKIRLPDTSLLNPNNTIYQNPNVGFFGNPYLEPTIFNTYEAELSAFEYFFINYSVTNASNQIVRKIVPTADNISYTSQNLDKVTIHSFNIGIPLPYMLFTKGLKETLKMDFNPDEINFLYAYAGHQKHVIPGFDTKGAWFVNLTSQILLPKKIKFTASFNTSTLGGNLYYFTIQEPLYQHLDLNFSRKFLSDNLSVSIYANDIFNTSRYVIGAAGTDLLYYTKNDSRSIGFSLNYKIPAKNKLAKEESNILTNEKKQEENILGN
jgi:hypothetical protein